MMLKRLLDYIDDKFRADLSNQEVDWSEVGHLINTIASLVLRQEACPSSLRIKRRISTGHIIQALSNIRELMILSATLLAPIFVIHSP